MNHLVYLKDEASTPSPQFARRFATVKAHFFSRNPDLWPVFREPGFATLNEFRARGLAPAARLNAWPDGRARLADLCETMPVPATMRTRASPWPSCCLPAPCPKIKDWENPQRRERHHHVGGSRHLRQRWGSRQPQPGLLRVCRGGRGAGGRWCQMALLAGYDPARATGRTSSPCRDPDVFVTSMAGLLGIRKSSPQAKHKGAGPLSGLPKAP